MPKNTKTAIRQIIEGTVLKALVKLEIKEPSKKIRKGLSKTSKELARFFKEELKREKRYAKSQKVMRRKKLSKASITKSKRKKKSK